MIISLWLCVVVKQIRESVDCFLLCRTILKGDIAFDLFLLQDIEIKYLCMIQVGIIYFFYLFLFFEIVNRPSINVQLNVIIYDMKWRI